MSNKNKRKTYKTKTDAKTIFVRVLAIVLCALTLLGALAGAIQFL